MITFRMEIDGLKKSGIRTDRKTQQQINYYIYVGYVVLPGYKHPQAVEYYSEQVMTPGMVLEVPVNAEVRDLKATFTPDYRAAKPIQKVA
ncbi:MAG: single-stranded DNA-binding protein [Inoviridae sp.]|nr:MAG: single-stranded DNA-binding protein [Inoviridae sp.]